ncbi:inositol polyphosphate 5-phosphatase [Lobulomyces angularis]|nr:inositol polyphosphate 5-phosphatase [Lobulomyces angularis]
MNKLGQSVNISGIKMAFKLLFNPSLAMPHQVLQNFKKVNYKQLKNEGGFSKICFDKDNTLTKPYEMSFVDGEFREIWNQIVKLFGKNNVCIVSNSSGTLDDHNFKEAELVEKSFGVSCLRHRLKKPEGGEELLNHFGIKKSPNLTDIPLIVVGDRLLTDIVYGNLNGALTILVVDIFDEKHDNFFAKKIRYFEKNFLLRFLKYFDFKPKSHSKHYVRYQNPRSIVLKSKKSTSSLVVEKIGANVILNYTKNTEIKWNEYTPLIQRDVYGTLGLIQINNDVFFSIITQIEKIAEFENNSTVYRILKLSFFSCISNKYDNLSDFTENLLSDQQQSNSDYQQNTVVVHPCQALNKLLLGGSFYFCMDLDLTRNMQKRETDFEIGISKTNLFQSFDTHFVWNQHLLKSILQVREKELGPDLKAEFDESGLAVMLMQGHCSTLEQRVGSFSFKVGIISRLSCKRAGTRFNTRGIDDNGNVSNFVETEFMFFTKNYSFSFTQIRGSVPLFWEQTGFQVTHKFTLTRGFETTGPAIRKHMEELIARYQKVHIVNLLKQNDGAGQEMSLGDSYRLHINKLKDLKDCIVFTSFDFHAVVKRDYEKLSNLTDSVKFASENYGFFLKNQVDGAILDIQKGVFRTNCLDCLDRTNVVQTVLAKQAVSLFLKSIDAGSVAKHDSFLTVFNTLWADNGDWLSKIYAGTGALKSSYTRQGKSTLFGFLDDAAKSVSRLYINNFQDEKRQDLIDLLLGKAVLNNFEEIILRNPLHELVNFEVNEREKEFATREKISIIIASFNVNGKLPHYSEPLEQWLFSRTCIYPELFVISIQELIQLTPGQMVTGDPEKNRDIWENGINKTLNSLVNGEKPEFNYAILRTANLVALGMFVFVREDKVNNIKNMEISIIKTGLGGMAGNKGGIGVSLLYYETRICFVCAHLAAGASNYEDRNRDYKTITEGINFSGKKIDDHDAVFWFGDFNYRISLPNEEVRSCIQNNTLDYLLCSDQLLNQQACGMIFVDYKEGPLNFFPTYKYDTGTSVYDTSEKMRIPSWTDRILYKGNNIKLLEYDRVELTMSDHRPIRGVFEMEVKIVDQQKKEKVLEELYKEKSKNGFKENVNLMMNLKKFKSNIDSSIDKKKSASNPSLKIKNSEVDGFNLIDIEYENINKQPTRIPDKGGFVKSAPVDPFSDDFVENSITDDPFSSTKSTTLASPSSDSSKWWEKDIDETWILKEGDGVNPFYTFN